MHADIPPRSEHAWQRAVIGSDAYYGMVLAGTIAVVVAKVVVLRCALPPP